MWDFLFLLFLSAEWGAENLVAELCSHWSGRRVGAINWVVLMAAKATFSFHWAVWNGCNAYYAISPVFCLQCSKLCAPPHWMKLFGQSTAQCGIKSLQGVFCAQQCLLCSGNSLWSADELFSSVCTLQCALFWFSNVLCIVCSPDELPRVASVLCAELCVKCFVCRPVQRLQFISLFGLCALCKDCRGVCVAIAFFCVLC